MNKIRRIVYAILKYKSKEPYWECWFEDGSIERRPINV